MNSGKKVHIQKQRIIWFGIFLWALAISMAIIPLFSQNLWQPNNPYNPIKKMVKGDVIRVIIQENIKTNYDYELKRDDTVTIRSTPDKNITDFMPAVDSTRAVNRKKNSKADNSNRIQGSMSVLVSELNEDGTARIDGVKIFNFHGQTSSLQLRGIIHPRDVNDRYEITSDRVANLAITVQGDLVKKSFPIQALNRDAANANQNNQNNQNDQNNQNNQANNQVRIQRQDQNRILLQYLSEILGEVMDQNAE